MRMIRATWIVAMMFVVGVPLVVLAETHRPWVLALPTREPDRSGDFVSPDSPYFYPLERSLSINAIVFALVLAIVSHLLPRLVAGRRVRRRYSIRFLAARSYRDPAAFDRVTMNFTELTVAQVAREQAICAYTVTVALTIASVSMWNLPIHASHCDLCLGALKPATYLVYFAIAFGCLLSHVPRVLLRMRAYRDRAAPTRLRTAAQAVDAAANSSRD
jgi:hypothetical protein